MMHGIQLVNILYSAIDKAALKYFLAALPVTQRLRPILTFLGFQQLSNSQKQLQTFQSHSKQITKTF